MAGKMKVTGTPATGLAIGLVVNWEKRLARRFVVGLSRWLKKRGHRLFFAEQPPRECVGLTTNWGINWIRKADLVVALGGDGTLLRAVRMVGEKEIPVMGVNLGGLGFLTEFATHEARAGIVSFERGRHQEERRMLLECQLVRANGRLRTGYAFNDCAVNMGTVNRVIEVAVKWEGKFVNKFAGDGLVVATPTGSTAYSLAAGGPVVYPTMRAVIVTPLCPHALAARPIVLPGNGVIEIELTGKAEQAFVTVDGQQRWEFLIKERLMVKPVDFQVRLVVPRGKSYFEILRSKLKWSGSQR